MGLFDTCNDIKHSNQRISENYLRKLGFKKTCKWGNPKYWSKDTEFWILEIMDEDDMVVLADVWYFPHTFKGYVTPFRFDAANKILAIPNNNHNKDFTCLALCKGDIQYAIERINQIVNEF